MLNFGSNIFDRIFSENNRKKIESFTIWSATIGFIIHLSLVMLNNYSIVNIGNESLLVRLHLIHVHSFRAGSIAVGRCGCR